MITKQIIDLEKENNIKIIYVTEVGSKLFGLDTPESDTDLFGIFIPNKDDVLLKNDKTEVQISKVTSEKNSKDDTDFKLISHYRFLDLLSKGETNAVDLLFSMFSNKIKYETSEIQLFKKYKDELVNSKVNSFIGFSLQMARKYGIKGTRLKELQIFLDLMQDFMKNSSENTKLFSFIQYIMDNHLDVFSGFKNISIQKERRINGNIFLNVLGKQYQDTLKLTEVFEKLENDERKYGDRVHKSTEGVDWKSTSHALRTLIQAEELLRTTEIKFPLKERELLLSIKKGELKIEEVQKLIETYLQAVKSLENNTALRNETSVEISNILKTTLLEW